MLPLEKKKDHNRGDGQWGRQGAGSRSQAGGGAMRYDAKQMAAKGEEDQERDRVRKG